MSRSGKILRATVFGLIALANLHVYGSWNRVLTADNQHYFYIAERAAAGVPPHVSHVDPKHMLTPMISAVAIRAGRVVGLDDVRAARVPSLVLTAAAVALAWLLAAELAGTAVAGHLAALGMLATWGLFHEAVIGVRPKVFMVFFLVAAHLAIARDRYARGGFYGACAFLCWQPAAVVLVGAGVAGLISGRPWRNVRRLSFGALVPIAVYEAYFVVNGALAVQLEQSYVLPFAGAGVAPPVTDILRLIAHNGRSELLFVAILPLVTAVTAFGFWWASAAEPRRTFAEARALPGWTAVFVAFHGAMAFTLGDMQAYPDLLFLQPYFAIIGGCALARVFSLMRNAGFERHAAICWMAVAGLLAANVWTESARDRRDLRTIEEQYLLGQLVELYLEEYDGVWAVGCTHLLGFNHVDNHSPYGFFFDDINQTVGADPNWRPLRDGREPELILNSRGLAPNLRPMLVNYVPVDAPAFAAHNVRVLRRRTGIEIKNGQAPAKPSATTPLSN